MSDITIACPRCCGTGRTELPRVLLEVLVCCFRQGALGQASWCAQEVAARLAIEPTAANNRLELLRKLGFLSRTKHGRTWRYARLAQAAGKGGG